MDRNITFDPVCTATISIRFFIRVGLAFACGNDHGDCETAIMTDGYRPIFKSFGLGDFFRVAMKFKGWLASREVHDFDVTPGDFADASTQGFGNSFFYSE